MSVSVIPTLKSKRKKYVNKITNAQQQIAKCEEAYETLIAFKTVVSRSQEDFFTINSSKENILVLVENVKKNSITAQRYHDGMKKIFTGVGSKIVGAVYTVLLSLISAKLKSYLNSVNDYEDDISSYEKKIATIDKQIKAAEKAEKLALEGGE